MPCACTLPAPSGVRIHSPDIRFTLHPRTHPPLPADAGTGGDDASSHRPASVRAADLAGVAGQLYEMGGRSITLPMQADHALLQVLKEALDSGDKVTGRRRGLRGVCMGVAWGCRGAGGARLLM
jgi:hypothetical protein